VAFVDRVREHLQQVAQAPEGLHVPTPFTVDEAALRRDLLGALERIEARDASDAGLRAVAELHRSWAFGERLSTFAAALARRLREGMAREATDDEMATLLRVALARRLGLEDRARTSVQTLELDRLAWSALDSIEDTAWQDVPRYAEQLRATSVQGGRARLTPIGRVCLDLQGRDAIRWLLHVEGAQSSGPLDPFRICRETAAHLATHEHAHWDVGPDLESGDDIISGLHPFASLASIQRLGALGLLTYTAVGPNETPSGYALFPASREILEEIGGAADSPMRLLAHALVQDETQRALTAVQPALAAAARASAAESIARQARLVAHELHNALVPVQVAIDGLYQLVPAAGAEPEVDRYRRRIDAGLARAFRFVDQSLAPTALLSGADDPFDVGACLRDAIAEVNGEARGALHLLPVPSLPPVVGSRVRFVLGLLNLVRNALQATRDRAARVELAADVEDGWVVVRVDDNGPGVPSSYRQAIFAEGFKLRPDGSGHGLSLVREVVEAELHGTVSCEESPLGGARFVLRLPIERRGQR
jgi:signal transduction histidine kinase